MEGSMPTSSTPGCASALSIVRIVARRALEGAQESEDVLRLAVGLERREPGREPEPRDELAEVDDDARVVVRSERVLDDDDVLAAGVRGGARALTAVAFATPRSRRTRVDSRRSSIGSSTSPSFAIAARPRRLHVNALVSARVRAIQGSMRSSDATRRSLGGRT